MPLTPEEEHELSGLESEAAGSNLSQDEERELAQLEAESSPAPSPIEKPSVLETIARQGRQGQTLGFSDEATGAIQSVGDELDPVIAKLGLTNPTVIAALKTAYGGANMNPLIGAGRALINKQNTGEYLSPEYKGERDIERGLDTASLAAHPVIGTAANIAGAATNPLTYAGGGQAAPKAAGYLGKVGKAAWQGFKQAATIGAAFGLGGSTEESPGGLALDTAQGAGVSGLTGGLVSGGLSAFNPSNLSSLAGKKAVQEADLPDVTLRKMAEKGPTMPYKQKLESIGHELLDQGIVGNSNLPEELATRNALLAKAGQQKIDRALGPIEKSNIQNFDNVKIIDALKAKYGHLLPEGGVLVDLESVLKSQGEGPINPTQGRYLRQLIDDKVNYNAGTDPKIKGKIISDARRMVAEELNRSIGEAGEAIGKPDLLPTFLEGNKQYSLAADTAKAFKKQVRSEFRPERGKVGEILTQIPVLRSGVHIAEAAGKAITPGAKYVDNLSKMVSQGVENLGQFGPILQQALQRGPAAAAAANHVLSQNSQEYRDLQRKFEETPTQ